MDMSEKVRKDDDDPTILKCELNGDAYFFGIGLDECENISLKDIRMLYQCATWYVYTWSD